MTLVIDFNTVKNGLVTTYHTVSAKVSEWTGRGVAIIKSGAETALLYLQQDRRIAAVSLVAVNLILIEVGDVFGQLIGKCLPNNTDGQRAFHDVVEVSVGIATVVAGVTAFAKYTKLPLNGRMITAISVATVFLRVCCVGKRC